MRITNLRRGRLVRMGAACTVLLLLIYALHKWSSENIENTDVVLLADSETSYYKSHKDVYPVLKTGNILM